MSTLFQGQTHCLNKLKLKPWYSAPVSCELRALEKISVEAGHEFGRT